MIETALVMPLLVAMFLLVWWVGTLYQARLNMQTAAIQGTLAAVQATGDSACSQAELVARKVYVGQGFDSVTCEVTGKDLTLTLRDTLRFNTPWGELWPISVTQKAVVP